MSAHLPQRRGLAHLPRPDHHMHDPRPLVQGLAQHIYEGTFIIHDPEFTMQHRTWATKYSMDEYYYSTDDYYCSMIEQYCPTQALSVTLSNAKD
jgi:hypothetical protein